MKILKLILLFFLLIQFLSIDVVAQNMILVSGGSASGSNGSVENSVGLVFYKIQTGTNGSVSQGVQQPYEISVVSAVEEIDGIHLKVTAFPNPTKYDICLRVENFDQDKINFYLYDISGKLLQKKELEGIETSIDMSNYANSIYILKISNGEKEIKTFKIIKN